MTAMLLHTMLAVVVIAWTYLVTTRVAYHSAWLWAGSAALVVIGYLAVVARYVFEGIPAQAQAVIGHISGTLLALAGAVCLVLFAVVSARAGRPSARVLPSEGARGIQADEEPVIVPDDDADQATSGPAVAGQAGGRAAPRRALPPEGDEA